MALSQILLVAEEEASLDLGLAVEAHFGEVEVADGPGASSRVGSIDERRFACSRRAVHRRWANAKVGALVDTIDIHALGTAKYLNSPILMTSYLLALGCERWRPRP